MTVKAPRDARWMYGLLLVAAFAWPDMQAQPRYGTSIFIQASQPTTGGYTGALWYDTTADALKVQKNDASWAAVGGSGGLPSGAIVLIDSGACPAGTSEIAAMNGKMPFGTLNAGSDVGTTGGSDTITPAGTNGAQTIAWPAGVPTAANESAHTHTAGTFVNAASATSGNCAATNIAAGTGSTTACKATAPNLTVSAQTHSGTLSAGSAHTHTLSWPAGVPTVGVPSFAGTQFDNRSAWRKVIFCKAT